MSTKVLQSGNVILKGSDDRPFLASLQYPAGNGPHPLIVFCHGFKSFMTWGAFPLLGKNFAERGLAFLSFSFSHNGTTPENAEEFCVPEAFGYNNFSRELFDLSAVLQAVRNRSFPGSEFIDKERIFLAGHSRGGGIALLKAAEDKGIRAVSVWGSVNEFGRYWRKNERERLDREGVIYIPNTRTGQMLPIYKQLYEDYEAGLPRLHIPTAVRSLRIPLQIIHGTADETVPVEAAEEMHSWNPQSELLLLPEAGHTFGMKHPWNEEILPEHSSLLLKSVIEFFASVG
jgi:pimeloyl-ACP methyl ester carboxylesterase